MLKSCFEKQTWKPQLLTIEENAMAVKNVVSEDDELMLVIQIELDKAVTKEVCDAVYETASLLPKEKTEQE